MIVKLDMHIQKLGEGQVKVHPHLKVQAHCRCTTNYMPEINMYFYMSAVVFELVEC